MENKTTGDLERNLHDLAREARSEAPQESLLQIMSRMVTYLPVSDEALAEEEEERRREALRVADSIRRRRWREMVPSRFHWCGTSDATPELLAKIRPVDKHGAAIPLAWLLPRVVSLRANAIFCGPAGTGKTSLAISALRARFFEPGPARVLFVPARALAVSRIQTAAGTGESSLVDRAMRADLLLVDDLGNERQTNANAVPDVILERHDAMRPTWVTSGFSQEELAKLYGSGVARRVFDGAVFRFGVTS